MRLTRVALDATALTLKLYNLKVNMSNNLPENENHSIPREAKPEMVLRI